MKTTAPKSLFKHLLEATEINDIQCRYIVFKLAENDVKTIINIKQTETLKYKLKTNNGNYKVEATELPLPISKVKKY